MCARNYSGGAERPFVGKHDISLEKFKSWFSPDFLKNIKNFYSCGNYGDPIIAKDCLEIYEYVRRCTNARLSLHTNGSARTVKWWESLAKAMVGNHEVTFGIYVFAESHILYRRGTDWNKIIENAKAFINAGGVATVDCLIFKHNEHEIEEFTSEMLKMGFKSVNIKPTGRFYDMEKFPVLSTTGDIEYYLEPVERQEYKKINFLKLKDISNDIKIWKDLVISSSVSPKCIQKSEIYIDSRGTVYPCCWVGSDMIEEPLAVSMPIHDLRNKMVENTKMHFNQYNELTLNNFSISEILSNNAWSVLYNEKPWTCVKNCKL
jgi:MoaA/NifB/PqqE/SkfB family radical SAM enzyme